MPAGGQGAIGIEIRTEDAELVEMLLPLAHSESTICVSAERAMNQHLNGGCQVPIAGYAKLIGEARDRVRLQGLVGDASGETILRAEAEGDAADAEKVGIEVAEQLLQQGAGEILAAIYDQDGPQETS